MDKETWEKWQSLPAPKLLQHRVGGDVAVILYGKGMEVHGFTTLSVSDDETIAAAYQQAVEEGLLVESAATTWQDCVVGDLDGGVSMAIACPCGLSFNVEVRADAGSIYFPCTDCGRVLRAVVTAKVEWAAGGGTYDVKSPLHVQLPYQRFTEWLDKSAESQQAPDAEMPVTTFLDTLGAVERMLWERLPLPRAVFQTPTGRYIVEYGQHNVAQGPDLNEVVRRAYSLDEAMKATTMQPPIQMAPNRGTISIELNPELRHRAYRALSAAEGVMGDLASRGGSTTFITVQERTVISAALGALDELLDAFRRPIDTQQDALPTDYLGAQRVPEHPDGEVGYWGGTREQRHADWQANQKHLHAGNGHGHPV